MLAAKSGCEPQLDVHLHAARNVGLTVDELREVLIQSRRTPASRPPSTRCAGCRLSRADEATNNVE